MIKLDSSNADIWFTSDTHFYHKNITRGESNWDNSRGVRDFDNINQMTDAIINGINKYVKEDDVLFHLGDWSFGGIDKIWEARKRIACKNIYLIAGNHDLHIIDNKNVPQDVFITTGVDEYPKGEFAYDKLYPDCHCYKARMKHLFKDVSLANLVKIDKTLVYMSHFPSEGVRFDKRSIHIHGHVHGTYPPSKSRLDVGIDNAFKLYKEYRPFSWKEIQAILK